MTDGSASSPAPDTGPDTGPESGASPTGRSTKQRLATGGSTLALAMMLANAGNYVLNLYLGRALGPADFSDANLMVTLMLSTTALSLGLEMVTARFVARLEATHRPEAARDVVRRLRRVAWIAGVGLALVLGAGAPVWQEVFNTASPWPFVVLAAGLPCYLAQSVGRGALQGTLRFEALALTFLVEMVVRLVVGILLVALGYGVMGATIGLSLSLVATWAVVAVLVGRVPAQRVADALSGTELRTYAGLVSVLLLAQIVANNSDVLVAKASLSPEAAGVYAAVALVGRAIFYLAWSVATVVFPVAAAAEPGKSGVLRGGLLIVGALGSACALGGLLVGGPILEIVLGEDYGGVSRLLAGYAVATTLFALANLAASVRLAQGRVDASWLVMAGAVLQVALLLVLRGDATELVWAQVLAMTALVVGVSTHHALVVRREGHQTPEPTPDPTMGGPQR